eukprot:138292_1
MSTQNEFRNNILFEEFIDVDCKSINKCKSLKRIIMILDFHQMITGTADNDNNNTMDLLMEYINKYTNLFNDYQHILLHHLNNRSSQKNDDNFSIINNKCIKYINCSLNSCKQYQRNNRNRGKEEIFDGLSSIYVEMLDTIHCYFVHSYHTGFRFKNMNLSQKSNNNELKTDQDNDESDNESDNDSDNDHLLCDDKQMEHLSKQIKSKRKALETIRGIGRIEKTKFIIDVSADKKQKTNPNRVFLDQLNQYLMQNNFTNNQLALWHYFINENEYDSDSLNQDIHEFSDENESNIREYFNKSSTTNTKYYHMIKQFLSHHYVAIVLSDDKPNINININYSFGQKFYYKDYYATAQHGDYKGDNPGYKCKDWYVPKKYENLKDEIINNELCTLNMAQFNIIHSKADTILSKNNSTIIKKYVFENVEDLSIAYGILEKEIKIHHILCILLYTDFTDLSYNFSKSFRRLNEQETNQEFKQRKREFYHWSKILISTIESFGTKMNKKHRQTFGTDEYDANFFELYYTGISEPVTFNNFVSKFYGPTSTTKQISVATIFAAHNGIILELKQMNSAFGPNLKFFNCSLLSCYGSEDERLFIGGYAPLQFHSIRTMKEQKNYVQFIDAMTKFNTILDGTSDGNHKCTHVDVKIINKFIHHEMEDGYSNQFPNYINSLFHQFSINRKYIKISMFSYTLNEDCNYSIFSTCLFIVFSFCLNFSFLCRLFKKCEKICIAHNHESEQKIDPYYLSLLLKEIENIESDKTNSLKTIEIECVVIEVDDAQREQFRNSLDALAYDFTVNIASMDEHHQVKLEDIIIQKR